MRIMFTGPRDLYVSDGFIEAALDNTTRGLDDDLVIVVGDATGIDWCVRNWAVRHGFWINEDLFVIRANWKEHGKKAGPIRNTEMVAHVGMGACIAIREEGRETKGTSDAVAQAGQGGLKVTGVRVQAIKVKPDVRVGMSVVRYEW